MHWFFIFDHSFGNKRVTSQQPQLLEKLKQKAIPVSYQEADSNDAITQIAQQAAARGHKKFIIVGGDQAVNHALQGLYQHDKSLAEFQLGALPWGSHNHWAEAHGIAADIDLFIDLLQNSRCIAHDIGIATYGSNQQHVFIDHLSIGISSHVLKQLPPQYSNFRYWWALLKVLRHYQPQTARCSEPKIEQRRALIMIASLGQYLGQRVKALPQANSYDGLLDVLTVENSSFAGRIKALKAAHNGLLKQQSVTRHTRLEQVSFDLRGDVSFECDGVIIAAPPVEVSVIPQAVQVLSHQS